MHVINKLKIYLVSKNIGLNKISIIYEAFIPALKISYFTTYIG